MNISNPTITGEQNASPLQTRRRSERDPAK
jgi:hypothetical protein